MGRLLRIAEPGFVYHTLNRGNGRRALFHKPADYEAFERILAEALAHSPMRLLAYCLMPNHWHLLLWPDRGQHLSRFVGWLSLTHAQRWHAHYQNAGTGHLYQGRFKSFPVQEDDHFYSVCRYVERNALRANLVERAELWRWGSLGRRLRPDEGTGLLSPWPLGRPENWPELVNAAQTEAELTALRRCVQRGQPYGEELWVQCTAAKLGLRQSLRPVGRPRKVPSTTSPGATARTLFE